MNGKLRIGLILAEAPFSTDLQASLDSCEEFSLEWVSTKVDDLAAKTFPSPDVILLNQSNTEGTLIASVEALKAVFSTSEVLLLTKSCDSNTIFKVIYAGVSSILCYKVGLAQIKKSILATANGGTYLSPSISRKIIDYFNGKSPEMLNAFSLTP